VRTCIGCRERTVKSELIRIVAVSNGSTTMVAPDLRGSAGGRGAHLHPSAACLELATRRKAFGRALRVSGPVDDTMVRSYVRVVAAKDDTEGDSNTVHHHDGHDHPAAPQGAAADRKRSTRS
jgi:predicted RNA-binding protein YlxR (DUF448 family)